MKAIAMNRNYEIGDIVSIPANVELLRPTISDPTDYWVTLQPQVAWIYEINDHEKVKILVDGVVWQTFNCNLYPYPHYHGEENGTSYRNY
jgi:hypothetical protein